MNDYFEDILKNIFITKESIEHIKKDVNNFLLPDIFNIVISYLNSESTVIQSYDFLIFNIFNYEFEVSLEKWHGYYKFADVHLSSNEIVKCYDVLAWKFKSTYVYREAINLFLLTHNRKSIQNNEKSIHKDFNKWNAKIYNPKSNIYYPQYNKNDFAILEYNIDKPNCQYIDIFLNPETLIIALDILRDALEQLGLYCD